MVLFLEADAFESGKEVFIRTEDEKVALPVGEYELEDNRILVVEEEGLIKEIKAEEHEEEEEEKRKKKLIWNMYQERSSKKRLTKSKE